MDIWFTKSYMYSNGEDPNQTPPSATSYLNLHCFPCLIYVVPICPSSLSALVVVTFPGYRDLHC